MTEAINYIPNRVRNAAVGGHVCGSADIIDDDLGLEQNAVNKEVMGIPYDSSNPNGMGRIVLKKNDNFKTVVEAQTNGNTIFIIKYDFTLTGNVTVPANCVLEFDGGSVNGNGTGKNTITTDNLIVNNISRHKIFSGIIFAGRCRYYNVVKLEWFISNYPVSSLDTTVDNTTEVRDCFACDVKNIEFPLDRFIHLTDTIHITKPINILTNGETYRFTTAGDGVLQNEEALSKPCVFSHNVITLLDYKIGPFDNNASVDGKISIGNITLYVNKQYTDLSDKEVPILNIETNGTSGWGMEIDCDIKSTKYFITYSEGEYDNFNNYTGIRIHAKEGGYFSYIKIHGYLSGLYYGIHASKDSSSSWITDITFDGNSWCCIGGWFETGSPINIFGSHQTAVLPPQSDDMNGYFIGALIRLYGYVWDYNSGGHSTTTFKSVKTPIKLIGVPIIENNFNIESDNKIAEEYGKYPIRSTTIIDLYKGLHTPVQNLLDAVFSWNYLCKAKALLSVEYKLGNDNILAACPDYIYNIFNLFNTDSYSNTSGNGSWTEKCIGLLPEAKTVNITIEINTTFINIGNGGSALPLVLYYRNQEAGAATINISKYVDGSYELINTVTIDNAYYTGVTNIIKLLDIVGPKIKVEISFNAAAGWFNAPTIIIPVLNKVQKIYGGPTAMRPHFYSKDAGIGFQYFDTTLGKPIWCKATDWNNVSTWVDAMGNDVSTTYLTKSGVLVNGNVPEFDGTDGAVKDSGKQATSIP